MKSIKNAVIAGFVLLITTYGCNDEMMGLSQSDEANLFTLRETYNDALVEQEVFKTSIEQDDSLAIHLHDSIFHHHEGLFEEYHNDYSHENSHDDHRHNNQGMQMMGNSMGHGYQDGHHMEDHDLMEDLLTDHQSVIH